MSSMDLERYAPGDEGEIWYEHWHRYHFVLPLASGKQVLDIACGEGYGTALLASRAARVVGVDVAAEVVARARRRYGALANVEYHEGSCERVPLPDASVDLAVSFETLEHIASPERLLDEAARVLRPGGVFVVSTPNKEIYSDARGYRNPFHVHELQRGEFERLLADRFDSVALLGQRVDFYSAIWPLAAAPASAQLLTSDNAAPAATQPGVADPMYLLAVCGDPATVETAAASFSLLSDRGHTVQAGHESASRQVAELHAHMQRVEDAYLAGQAQIAQLVQERDRLAARLAQLEGPKEKGWGRK